MILEYKKIWSVFLLVALFAFSIFLAVTRGGTTIGLTLFSNPDLNSGLVGHWTFDGKDMSGTTVNDASGNGSGGTFQGVDVDPVAHSLRFNDNDSAYLSWTPGSASNQTIWTYSGWVKRGNLGIKNLLGGRTGLGATYTLLYFDTDDTLRFLDNQGANIKSSALFRDPSAWLHIVVVVDTTESTAANRVKMYVDGEQLTSFSIETYPGENVELAINSTETQQIGENGSAIQYFDGYMAEVQLVDGQALGPENFGETDSTSGGWKPKQYTGTYGTNGFHLDFADSSNLGNDVSGNDNDWTENNLDATDKFTDTPTNNHATLHPIVPNTNGVFSEGNLSVTSAANSGINNYYGSIGVSSGKWHFEATTTGTGGSASGYAVGIASSLDGGTSNHASANFGQIMYDSASGNVMDASDGTVAGNSYGSTFTSGDRITVEADLDVGTIEFFKNGVSQGTYTPDGSISGTAHFPVAGDRTNTAQIGYDFTFNEADFVDTPTSGFKALSSANLPTPAIEKPSEYFDAVTYTGNGSTQSITGLDFQPDFTWLKDRDASNSHGLFDAVRGATEWLASNSTAAESTDTDTLTAFDSSGFSLGADTKFNTNTNDYISWNWRESATAGFDIVSYTGNGGACTASHTHSLGTTPKFAIFKPYSATGDWIVYHDDLNASADDYLKLNTTDAKTSYGSWLGKNADTFCVTAESWINTNGTEYVAHLFAEKEGFSKFGSYTGNGSTDGPFVYTGFEPRFVMVKRTNSMGDWALLDTEREGYNVDNDPLFANSNAAEATTDLLDINANGFKLRSTDTDVNGSATEYIYAAFAELPFGAASALQNTGIAEQVTPGRLGQALEFDGNTNYIDIGDTSQNVRTVSFWMRADSTTEKIIDLNGTANIEVSSGTITANNFTSPTIYVDGEVSSTITADEWHHVVVTTGTNISASDLDIGRVGGSYFDGVLDDVRTYDRALSAGEVERLYGLGATTIIGKTITTNPDLENGLVGHWTFDGKDMYTNVNDRSSENNDGALQGQTSTTTAPGIIGQALLFDGSDDRVVTNTSVGNFGSDDFTVALWVKREAETGGGSNDAISTRQSGVPEGWIIYVSAVCSSGGVATYISASPGGNWDIANGESFGSFDCGEWHHIALTRSGNTFIKYLDGVNAGTFSSSSTIDDAGYALTIGDSAVTLVEQFKGALDDVRIYDRALSADEITRLYNLGR